MKKRTPISKIMSTNIKTVNTTQNLKEVSSIFEEEHIRHIPVVSGSKVIGIISKTDLERISFVDAFNKDKVATAMYDILSIEQVMTKDPMTVNQQDTIYDVSTILSQHDFHALPVLDGNGIVGIVTSTDLIKYLIAQY